MKGVVLKEIVPQIVFSTLLTVIVLTSFIVTYEAFVHNSVLTT